MVDNFVKNADPVDGVISSISEKYDIEETGRCKFDELIQFMEDNNYLEAD